MTEEEEFRRFQYWRHKRIAGQVRNADAPQTRAELHEIDIHCAMTPDQRIALEARAVRVKQEEKRVAELRRAQQLLEQKRIAEQARRIAADKRQLEAERTADRKRYGK